MRRRTSALVTFAVAAAAAAGIAVPALATSGSAAPPVALADIAGSGQSVIDWNRQLVSILGAPGLQPATVHPTRSFAITPTYSTGWASSNDPTESSGPHRRTAVSRTRGSELHRL